jgi:hypothetical protein
MLTEEDETPAPACVDCGAVEPASMAVQRMDGVHGWILKRRHAEGGLRFDAFCPQCRPSWRDLSSSAVRVRALLVRAAR